MEVIICTNHAHSYNVIRTVVSSKIIYTNSFHTIKNTKIGGVIG